MRDAVERVLTRFRSLVDRDREVDNEQNLNAQTLTGSYTLCYKV
jgi:hypothetical protein